MILASTYSVIKDWLEHHQNLLGWLGVLSLITFLATAAIIPILIARIPHDYFLDSAPREEVPLGSNPALRMILLILKNVLGLLIVLTGLSMVFLPGQGLLTMLVGILLLNFPGKRRLELSLVRRRPILRSINWIRRKAGRPPLALPPATRGHGSKVEASPSAS
jgi:hypothetical protein